MLQKNSPREKKRATARKSAATFRNPPRISQKNPPRIPNFWGFSRKTGPGAEKLAEPAPKLDPPAAKFRAPAPNSDPSPPDSEPGSEKTPRERKNPPEPKKPRIRRIREFREFPKKPKKPKFRKSPTSVPESARRADLDFFDNSSGTFSGKKVKNTHFFFRAT